MLVCVRAKVYRERKTHEIYLMCACININKSSKIFDSLNRIDASAGFISLFSSICAQQHQHNALHTVDLFHSKKMNHPPSSFIDGLNQLRPANFVEIYT